MHFSVIFTCFTKFNLESIYAFKVKLIRWTLLRDQGVIVVSIRILDQRVGGLEQIKDNNSMKIMQKSYYLPK